jgi:GxxExxY protein
MNHDGTTSTTEERAMFEPTSPSIESNGARLLDAAFEVHRKLGPGLLESVYELCVCHELAKMNVPFQRQVCMSVKYDDIQIDAGLRLDIVVGNEVIGELKAVESILPIHEAQLLTYLKLTEMRLGFLINFNVPLLKNGIKRIIV